MLRCILPENKYVNGILYPSVNDNPFFITQVSLLPVVNFAPGGDANVHKFASGEIQETSIRIAMQLQADVFVVEKELKLVINALKGK